MIDLSKYKTVILDLGGVIIDIAPDKVVKELAHIGTHGHTPEQIYKAIKKEQLVEKHEVGQLDDTSFIAALARLVGQHDHALVVQSWLAMLGGIPYQRIATIQKLKQTHKVLLLSNTNHIHTERIMQYLHVEHNTSFDELFDEVFLSQKIGHRKPSREIYEYVLRVSGIDPATAVFVDDVPENAKSAELVGISGYHLDLSKYKLHQIFKHE